MSKLGRLRKRVVARVFRHAIVRGRLEQKKKFDSGVRKTTRRRDRFRRVFYSFPVKGCSMNDGRNISRNRSLFLEAPLCS